MPSLLISDAEFQMLPDDVQQHLIARFLPTSEEVAAEPVLSNEDEDPPDLSPAQAKKVISGCSPKTIEVIRKIIEFPVTGFKLEELEANLGSEPGGLKGSWTGLTKVSRRVLGDTDAALIWWTKLEDGSFSGRISSMTHRSFHKALGG